MKKYSVGEIALLIMCITVCISFITVFIGMIISNKPTTLDNMEIRKNLVELLDTITALIIGLVSGLLLNKKDKE